MFEPCLAIRTNSSPRDVGWQRGSRVLGRFALAFGPFDSSPLFVGQSSPWADGPAERSVSAIHASPPGATSPLSGIGRERSASRLTDFRLMLSISLEQPWRPADPFIGQGPVWLPGREAPAAHDAPHQELHLARSNAGPVRRPSTASAGTSIGRPGFSQPHGFRVQAPRFRLAGASVWWVRGALPPSSASWHRPDS